MADNTHKISVYGIGFRSGLTLLFIGLKLTNYIDWPWILLLSPLWAPYAAVALLVVAVGVVVRLVDHFDET